MSDELKIPVVYDPATAIFLEGAAVAYKWNKKEVDGPTGKYTRPFITHVQVARHGKHTDLAAFLEKWRAEMQTGELENPE